MMNGRVIGAGFGLLAWAALLFPGCGPIESPCEATGCPPGEVCRAGYCVRETGAADAGTGDAPTSDRLAAAAAETSPPSK
jgi:hypothetical protein